MWTYGKVCAPTPWVLGRLLSGSQAIKGQVPPFPVGAGRIHRRPVRWWGKLRLGENESMTGGGQVLWLGVSGHWAARANAWGTLLQPPKAEEAFGLTRYSGA